MENRGRRSPTKNSQEHPPASGPEGYYISSWRVSGRLKYINQLSVFMTSADGLSHEKKEDNTFPWLMSRIVNPCSLTSENELERCCNMSNI